MPVGSNSLDVPHFQSLVSLYSYCLPLVPEVRNHHAAMVEPNKNDYMLLCLGFQMICGLAFASKLQPLPLPSRCSRNHGVCNKGKCECLTEHARSISPFTMQQVYNAGEESVRDPQTWMLRGFPA